MKGQTTILLLILAVLLCVCHLVPLQDPFSLLEPFARGLPEALQMALAMLVTPLMMLYSYSFAIGTFIGALIVWLTLSREPAKSHPLHPLVLPILSILWLTVQAVPFLQVPPGSRIRPMAWAAYTLTSALALMTLSIIQNIGLIRKGKNEFICAISLFLSVAIIVVPSFSLHTVARIQGFELAP